LLALNNLLQQRLYLINFLVDVVAFSTHLLFHQHHCCGALLTLIRKVQRQQSQVGIRVLLSFNLTN